MPVIVSAKSLRCNDELKKIPNQPGYYKWYAEREDLEKLLKPLEVKFDDVCEYLDQKDGKYCIYVGISKKIRKRLNWHVNDRHTDNRVRTRRLSTLRQSISSLIAHNQYEQKETDCFIVKLTIEYEVVEMPIGEDAVRLLEDIERSLMEKHLYPLNIQSNNHKMFALIKGRLQELRRQSRIRSV